MRNIKLTIEYDGTNYHGWQSQINASTVQDVLCAAVRKLTGEEVLLTGSSRTDTGVHAYGQVANFHTLANIPPDKYTFALNTLLPDDIVIRKSEEVNMDFHSRFSTKSKKYRYSIFNSEFPSALLRNRAYHVFQPLDLDAMKEGARHFLGTHDFISFMASGSSVKTTIRKINEISIGFENIDCENPGRLINFEIEGNGFLYNMVRIIAGTLVYVGRGKIKPDDISDIIACRDRRKAGNTAPAYGLYLMKVTY